MEKTKTKLYQTLTGVFIGCLLISNVLASKTFIVAGVTLPTAVIIFPIVYITNDMLAEIFGYQKTRRIIVLGFIMNAIAVTAYTIAIQLPTPDFATDAANAFAITLGSTGRILIASFAAYIVGSLLNAKIMVKMKQRNEKTLMARCIVSTLAGEGVDALLFITIAFAGTMPFDKLIIMVIAQALFKTAFECVVYPVTKVIINNTEKRIAIENGTT